MTEQPWIIVGFVNVLPYIKEFAPGSVIVIDEPDVIRKGDVKAALEGASMLRELIEWEYQLPASADEFFNTYPDLDPALVSPLVEYATPFAARLAERYGVPGAGAGAAQVLRDKSLLRKVSRAAGVPNPASREVTSPDEVREFAAAYPGSLVLKPANRQASVGTKVMHSLDGLDAAWEECIKQDEGNLVPDRDRELRMLIEQFVKGEEYSVELLVREGEVLFSNVTGKLLFAGPRPIELGHTVPAAGISAELSELLVAQTETVIRSVGFGSGIIHCEWIVSEGTPYLVECAGRFPGDGIPMLIEEAYQINLARDFYTVMQGGRPEPMPRQASGGAAVRFMEAVPGEVVSITGVEEARELPGVLSLTLKLTPGDTVRELRSSWDRVGSVMARGADSLEALRNAEAVVAAVGIETTPATAVN
ncbi:biotin carboxylase [Kitasatospora gansuensis]|uniref:Biotin carboxylase n=1 Tax=Kitasatospora gansuensis TaxID=258050 RepID=A0A7W7S6Z9_9ACTN|nr:ATP-grasp domain-containing protein [Kitasatospora gansuensis]MBB4944852.1 biotin carboxylase [Kitasatospora gansuensis]